MSTPTILHICNDYLGSKVYQELYDHLALRGIDQTVFVPMRPTTVPILNGIDYHKLGYKVVPSATMRKYHRYLFGLKQRYLYKNLVNKIDLSKINCVHATTLFSDGVLAFNIYRRYEIPYIVTVRSTDISTFLKYRPDLAGLALKILKHAKQIVFISHALREKFFEKLVSSGPDTSLSQKTTVIPNGLNNYWLSNIKQKKEIAPFKVIYVGTLLHRKNISALANVILEMKDKFSDLELTIVGEGGSDEPKIRALAKNHPECITYLGRIRNMESLMKLYTDHHLFAMPSYNETFGLVYIEALTQGLPILYSKNDGVDGFIPPNVGIAVKPQNLSDLKKGLEIMLTNYESFDLSQFNFDDFEWCNIATKYYMIYQSLIT